MINKLTLQLFFLPSLLLPLLAQYIRQKHSRASITIITIDTDLVMSSVFQFVASPRFDLCSIKGLDNHYLEVGFKSRLQMLFGFLNSGSDETKKNYIVRVCEGYRKWVG